MANKPRKVLQIKKGEYILKIIDRGIETTYNIEDALDIRHWSIEQLGNMVGNLHKVGYTKAKIVTIEEEVKADV
jgi:hypothetical protein